MIDLDERGRAAAADLQQAVTVVTDTDAAWDALVAGPVVPTGERRRRRTTAAVIVAGAAAAIVVIVAVAMVGGRDHGVQVVPATVPLITATVPPTTVPTTVPEPTTRPSTVPRPATSAPTGTAPGPGTEPLASVLRAADLPAVVSAATARAAIVVGGGPGLVGPEGALTIELPDGRVVIDNPGDGGDSVTDPATGESVWLGDDEDGKRVQSVDDAAVVEGAPAWLAVRGYPCNTEGARCGGFELTLITPDGSRPNEVVIGVGTGTSSVGAVAGRFSLSDSGLVAGVGRLGDAANVPLLLDTTIEPSPDGPQATDLGRWLGLNGVATTDPDRRIDALTVDQTGRAIAWLDAAGITVVDLVTGERRSFALAERPTNPLPVLDLALAGPGISDGAVLLSSVGLPAYANEPPWVIDLSDGSVAEVADLGGAVTFSAARG